MSMKIEFDDIRRAIVGRVVIVVDVALPPPAHLVDCVRLIEGIATEVRWLPMADEWIYRRWHRIWEVEKLANVKKVIFVKFSLHRGGKQESYYHFSFTRSMKMCSHTHSTRSTETLAVPHVSRKTGVPGSFFHGCFCN